jgi:hypothetical protein
MTGFVGQGNEPLNFLKADNFVTHKVTFVFSVKAAA